MALHATFAWKDRLEALPGRVAEPLVGEEVLVDFAFIPELSPFGVTAFIRGAESPELVSEVAGIRIFLVPAQGRLQLQVVLAEFCLNCVLTLPLLFSAPAAISATWRRGRGLGLG